MKENNKFFSGEEQETISPILMGLLETCCLSLWEWFSFIFAVPQIRPCLSQHFEIKNFLRIIRHLGPQMMVNTLSVALTYYWVYPQILVVFHSALILYYEITISQSMVHHHELFVYTRKAEGVNYTQVVHSDFKSQKPEIKSKKIKLHEQLRGDVR